MHAHLGYQIKCFELRKRIKNYIKHIKLSTHFYWSF